MTKAFSTDSEADIAAVNDIWPQYCASLIDGDMDRWISLWADDGIQMPPDTPARKGKEKIREANQLSLDLYHWDIAAINVEETHVAGDWAFSRGNYTWAWTPQRWERENGGYREILDHFSKTGRWFLEDCPRLLQWEWPGRIKVRIYKTCDLKDTNK
jgi:ketosteroid isomerase-like protein